MSDEEYRDSETTAYLKGRMYGVHGILGTDRPGYAFIGASHQNNDNNINSNNSDGAGVIFIFFIPALWPIFNYMYNVSLFIYSVLVETGVGHKTTILSIISNMFFIVNVFALLHIISYFRRAISCLLFFLYFLISYYCFLWNIGILEDNKDNIYIINNRIICICVWNILWI